MAEKDADTMVTLVMTDSATGYLRAATQQEPVEFDGA